MEKGKDIIKNLKWLGSVGGPADSEKSLGYFEHNGKIYGAVEIPECFRGAITAGEEVPQSASEISPADDHMVPPATPPEITPTPTPMPEATPTPGGYPMPMGIIPVVDDCLEMAMRGVFVRQPMSPGTLRRKLVGYRSPLLASPSKCSQRANG